MSLFRRKGSSFWWVAFKHNGQRIQQSSGTEDRRAAQEFHDRLKSDLWKQSALGEKPKYLWNEAVVRWCEEQAHKKTLKDDIAKFKWLHTFFNNRPVESITRDDIDRVVSAKRKEGVSPATINRHLALIRAVLRRCMREWDWLDKVPAVRLLKEPKLRVRWLTQEQAKTLLDELPSHQKAMTVFALSTGLRQGNVKGLRWERVDLERRMAWVEAGDAKAGKAIPVPLNESAIQVLNEQAGKHPEYVFTFRGKPIKQPNTKAWKKALVRAGIENFRWHDLRHCWASWHVQAGTRTEVLQELGGWQTQAMVRRYAHLDSSHLAAAAASLPAMATF